MNKLTKIEKYWILYDVANSAFIMMVSTIIPIFFKAIASNAGLSASQSTAYWGYALSISTLIVAFIGPTLGRLADEKDKKKKYFLLFLAMGCIGCAIMGFMQNWLVFLAIFLIARVGYQSANVFYDAMLTDVTSDENSDLVSSYGYALGYIGSCIPFVVCIVLVLNPAMIGLNTMSAIAIAFIITAIWWFGLAMPLARNYKQIHYNPDAKKESFTEVLAELKNTLVKVKNNKPMFMYLLAYFFYIDGVYTIIDEAVAIGTALGLNQMGLLVILLLTQVVAFAFATLFGKLSEKYSSVQLITVCILGYFAVAIYALFMKELWQFGIMAFVVGMFQGAIQALSRSYFAQIIPANASGEYFGIYDICGKGAAFMGTTLVGITVSITNSVNVAVATLTVLFILGLFFFRIATKEDK